MSNKTEQLELEKAHTEASQALRDSGKAMNRLLDLVINKQLPLITFLEFMDGIESTAQAKIIEAIKHD